MVRKIINRVGGGIGNQMFNYAVCEKLARDNGAVQCFDTTDSFVFKYLVPLGDNARSFQLYAFKGPRRCKMWGRGIAPYFFLALWILGKKASWKLFERILNRFGIFWWHPETAVRSSYKPIPDGFGTVYSTGICWDIGLLPPKQILRKDFSLHAPLSAESRKIAGLINGEGTVALHVRRTDYITLPMPNNLPLAYYRRATEKMKEKIANPAWFVFSDDPDWCVDAFSFLENAVFVKGNKDTPWEDIELMKMCRHHIIANSSFSWWGAYLAQDGGITMYPRHWGPDVNFMPPGESFIPADWIAVEDLDGQTP